MKKILNTAHIAELSYYEESYNSNNNWFILEYRKGDKIDYLFPFLHKEKYAKEDYYREWGDRTTLYTISEMSEKIKDIPELFIRDGLIYEKSHVKIIMTNENMYTKYFNTNQECEVFAEDIRNKFISSIELEIE